MTRQQSDFGSMLDPAKAAEELHRSGARMTAQRRAVLEILAGNRTHPTAETIVAGVRERLGCVAPATVYNTLDVLEDLGFVRRIDGLENRAHFDPDTSEHCHAICIKCRQVWDVAAVDLPNDLPSGFRVIDVLIQGVCSGCRMSSSGQNTEEH